MLRPILLGLIFIFNQCSSTNQSNNSEEMKLQMLGEKDRIKDESIIGIYQLPKGIPVPAMDILKVELLFQQLKLSLPPCSGKEITNVALKEQINKELGQSLGGIFNSDLNAYLKLQDALVSAAQKSYFEAGNMTVDWDKPQTAFYELGFKTDDFMLQAIGEAGRFHLIALIFPLSKEVALNEDGLPKTQPIGPVPDLLKELSPKLWEYQWENRSADFEENVYDTYLAREKMRIKAGVREDLGTYDPNSGKSDCFYCVRINIDWEGTFNDK